MILPMKFLIPYLTSLLKNEIMCIFNHDCNISDGSCRCLTNHHEPEELNGVVNFLAQQGEILKSIATQNEYIIQCLSQISMSVSPARKFANKTKGNSMSNSILEFLTGKVSDFPYEIRLLEPLPEPFYKNRIFTIKCAVFDSSGNQVSIRGCFKVLLYTDESPPILIDTTKSGDKMIKGNFEVETDKEILFDKLMFKEASSHHVNRRLIFVVSSNQTHNIKPLIVTNIIIKTRKDMAAVPAKKKKLVES